MSSFIAPQTSCLKCGSDFPNAQAVRELIANPNRQGSYVIPGPPEKCPSCGERTR